MPAWCLPARPYVLNTNSAGSDHPTGRPVLSHESFQCLAEALMLDPRSVTQFRRHLRHAAGRRCCRATRRYGLQRARTKSSKALCVVGDEVHAQRVRGARDTLLDAEDDAMRRVVHQ